MRLEESFRALLEAMTSSYETSLHEAGFEAAAYLTRRGIGKDTASCYRLGLVNDDFPEHAQYAGMLCIPYLTKLGGVVSLKFRRAHNCNDSCTHSKYISPYGVRMYNTAALDRADREGYICICEGEIDAIILDSAGFPAIGIPGVDTWTGHPEWRCAIAGCPRVYVWGDSDDAGRRFSQRVCSDIGKHARPITIPVGGDVNDWYLSAGRDDFVEAAGSYVLAA